MDSQASAHTRSVACIQLGVGQVFSMELGVHDRLAEGIGDSHDVRSSPGVRLGPEDLEAVLMRQTSVPHRTHRFVKDFEAHGYTDRCPGCSSLLLQMAP